MSTTGLQRIQSLPPYDPEYPETDGQPMTNSTTQADVMMTLKGNLEVRFRDRDDVFVAMDLFWYPVKGKPKIRLAPDVLVALGRPKDPRRSYKQWEEDNILPQVVFAVQSEANTPTEMRAKFRFYQRYGVQEYYTNRADKVHELLRVQNPPTPCPPQRGRFFLARVGWRAGRPRSQRRVCWERERLARMVAEMRCLATPRAGTPATNLPL